MNKFLEKDIRLKLGYFKDEKITDEDLESIRELGINNFTFSNKNKEIDLEELKNFPNLQILTLQYFKIDDNAIKILTNLQKLSSIHLASCLYDSKDTYEFQSLENLIINSCNFEKLSSIIAPKYLTVNGIAKQVDISTIKGKNNIVNLKLTNIMQIKNFKEVLKMQKLEDLSIDGSKVDSKRTIVMLKKKIPVSHEERSLNIT